MKDETTSLDIQWGADGLIAAVVQDASSKDVLMVAWMNKDSLQKTMDTGEAHFWSRSRGELWHKGATSGAIQQVREIRIDCDQDCVLLLVDQQGPGACHTGRKSCFYRGLESGTQKLIFTADDAAS